jgi:hypothetical protein
VPRRVAGSLIVMKESIGTLCGLSESRQVTFDHCRLQDVDTSLEEFTSAAEDERKEQGGGANGSVKISAVQGIGPERIEVEQELTAASAYCYFAARLSRRSWL